MGLTERLPCHCSLEESLEKKGARQLYRMGVGQVMPGFVFVFLMKFKDNSTGLTIGHVCLSSLPDIESLKRLALSVNGQVKAQEVVATYGHFACNMPSVL